MIRPTHRAGSFSHTHAENLRASDALFSPEIALSLDRDGKSVAYSFLPATWMPTAPEATIIGPMTERPLSALVRREVVEPLLELRTDPAAGQVFELLLADRSGDLLAGGAGPGLAETLRETLDDELSTSRAMLHHLASHDLESCARVLEVRPLLRWLATWPSNHRAYYASIAERIADLCGDATCCAYDLFTFDSVRALPVPAVSHFLTDYLDKNERAASALSSDLAAEITTLRRRGLVWRYTGLRTRVGMVQIEAEPRRLSRASLNLSLRAAWSRFPDEGLIEPLVTMQEHGRVRVEFDGLTATDGPEEERDDSIAAFVAMVSTLAGGRFARRLAEEAGCRPDQRAAPLERGRQEATLDPIGDVFEHLARGRNDAIWRNGEALACMVLERWREWPAAEADQWRRTIRGFASSLLRQPGARRLSDFATAALAGAAGVSA